MPTEDRGNELYAVVHELFVFLFREIIVLSESLSMRSEKSLAETICPSGYSSLNASTVTKVNAEFG
jgi:hypothetical protein